MKSVKMFLILLILAGINNSYPNNGNELIKEIKSLSREASIQFDEGKLRQVSALCERILAGESGNSLAHYYRVYSNYQLLQKSMNNNDKDLFDQLFSSAIENVKAIEEDLILASEANVLLASINMMKIAVTPQEAPQIARQIHSYLDKAIKLDENNPRVFLIRGMMLLNTPEMFGGSIDGAIELFLNAINLFAAEKKDDISPDWGLLETHAWLGKAYQRKGKIEEAKNIFEKALSIEPEYGWVKYVLLPRLLENKDQTATREK